MGQPEHRFTRPCAGNPRHLRNFRRKPSALLRNCWHYESYLRAAQAYMLISMPTGTSTIFGVFQAIVGLLAHYERDLSSSSTGKLTWSF